MTSVARPKAERPYGRMTVQVMMKRNHAFGEIAQPGSIAFDGHAVLSFRTASGLLPTIRS